MTILCQRFVSGQLSVSRTGVASVNRFSQVIINCSPHLPLTPEVGKTETYSPSQAHFALKSHRLAVQSTVD